MADHDTLTLVFFTVLAAFSIAIILIVGASHMMCWDAPKGESAPDEEEDARDG